MKLLRWLAFATAIAAAAPTNAQKVPSHGSLVFDGVTHSPAIGLTTTDLLVPLRVTADGKMKITSGDAAVELISTQTKIPSTGAIVIDTGDGIGIKASPLAGLTDEGLFVPISVDGTGKVRVSGGGGGGGTESPLTTKGDVWGYNSDNARIPVGSNGQVLTADSAQTLGLKWATPAATGVTSVALALPNIFSVSGSPVTSTGTLTGALATQSANRVFAGPTTGSAATPAFRALVVADIPTLNQNTTGTADNVVGVVALANGGTGQTSANNALNALLPDQTSNTGKFLQTDGTNTSWAEASLPALTAGSVPFSDGATFTQDNAAFFWNDTSKVLFLGHNSDPSGDSYAQNSYREFTDPAAGVIGNVKMETRLHLTDDNAVTVNNINNILKLKVDAGKTLGGLAVGNLSLFSRVDADDEGAIQYGAGYYAQLAFGNNAAKTQATWAGFLTGFNSIDASGATVAAMYDFYAIGNSIPVGAVTSRFGIYIEPDTNYTKHNWLSGDVVLGGSSYSSPNSTVSIQGNLYSSIGRTDEAAFGYEVHSTTDTTVDGSINSYGIQGSAAGTVQTGATNDKSVSGTVMTAQRGDGTDEGVLSELDGSLSLLIHNSGPAGVTNVSNGFLVVSVTQQGTITDHYDFRSERAAAGGTMTNHWGVYIKDDSTTPVKNWLSGQVQVGGSSFAANASAAIDVSGSKAILFPRLTQADVDALTPVNGMTVYNTDDDQFQCYTAGSWGNCGSGGGGGANQTLSNLTAPTAIDQDLLPVSAGSNQIGADGVNWATVYASGIRGSDTSNAINVSGGEMQDTTGTASINWADRTALDTDGQEAIQWVNRYLADAAGNSSVRWDDRVLLTAASVATLNWESSTLLDLAGGVSIDWENRTLSNPGADVMIDYSNAGYVSLESNRAANVTDPVDPQDAATKAYVDSLTGVNGVQLLTSAAQPTCDAGHRGLMWNIQGAAGVADIFQICQKTVLDTYVWTTH